MARRNRLDAELVRRGLARSREQAVALVEAGRVQLRGVPARKAAAMVDPADPLLVSGADPTSEYVSRGGHKLAGALAAFAPAGLVVAGRRCLDAGASTGGFTDVLLRADAAEVVAVDVGYGQLAWSLRNDSRVRVHERTNVRTLTPESIGGPVDLTVADLSFISLRLVLPALAACTRADGDLALMVKPQFEVGRERVGAGGVVRDPELRAQAVLDVATAAATLRLRMVTPGCATGRPGPGTDRGDGRATRPGAVRRRAGRGDGGGGHVSERSERTVWRRPVPASRPSARCSRAGATVTRTALLVTHTGRRRSTEHARTVAADLIAAGFEVRVVAEEAEDLDLPGTVPVTGPEAAEGAEIVFALGGDGTFLRAAELARPAKVPLLGINLGKVGFLAEAEIDDLDVAVRDVVSRNYSVDERLTLDVTAEFDGGPTIESWALNEISVEKGERAQMLELLVDVDGRPLSRYGCDGVVCATPTGSTAYAFSGGGPVVWPEVEALLLVPISAHALFSRPLVTAPTSTMTITVDPFTTLAVLCCDGRRVYDLPPGARVTVRRGALPVRVVRLRDRSFTARLVAKFDLPVHGWRGNRR